MSGRSAAIDQALRVAYHAARLNKFADADRVLTALLAADPDLAAANHLHGVVLHRLGRLEEALPKLERAIRIAPAETALQIDYGNLVDDRGDSDGAIAAYDRAMAIDPRRSDAARNAARVLRRIGKLEEAKLRLERAIQAQPADVDAHCMLGALLLDLRRAAEAASVLDAALALDPANRDVLALRASAEAARGLPSGIFYRAAIEAAPDDPALALGHAVALYEAGEETAALRLAQTSVERWPAMPEAHRTLAELRWQLGDRDAFDRSLEEALKTRSDDAMLWNSWLALLARAERHDAVLLRADQARRALGDQSFLDFYAAVAASETGQVALADGLFDRLGESGPAGWPVARLRHLLRSRKIDTAVSFVDRRLANKATADELPYFSLVWRMAGDDRAAWLDGQKGATATIDLGLSPTELAELGAAVRRLHHGRTAPLAQSLREGTQTNGDIFSMDVGPITALAALARREVEKYAHGLLAVPGGHPLSDLAPSNLDFAGSWSVRLSPGGFHVPHHHPRGVISSALYVALPPSNEHEGWLQIGAPPPELNLPLEAQRIIEPKPGRLVLFPSFVWHNTLPFSQGERLSIAFDVKRRA